MDNLFIWIFGAISLLFFIAYGIFGHRPSISRISSDAVRDRVSSIDNSIQSARNRDQDARRNEQRERERQNQQRERDNQTRRQRERETEARRQRERENDARQQRERETEARRQRERAIQHPTVIRHSVPQTSKPTSSSSTLSQSQLEHLRPKAGTLSEDDFKCVFCFKMPKLPDDKNRGIILCPNCKHPAHADEFRNWLKNSTLCSRCDGEIASRYRINPEIISTKTYLEAARQLLKRK